MRLFINTYIRPENYFERETYNKMDNSPGVSPPKKFQRSKNNVVISGVCSGIAEYLNTDAAIIRIIALLTLLLGSWSAVAYLLTALLLPVEQNPKQLSLEEMKTLRKENFRTVLGGLMILTGVHFAFISFGIGDSSRIFILPQSFVFPVISFAAGIYILTSTARAVTFAEEFHTEKFFRSKTDKKFFGVCGGLGNYLNIDSFMIRIIFFLCLLLTLGLFALSYLLLAVMTQFETDNKLE